MQRVLLIGPCGAGKSTLAAQLAARTGLPLHHMDQLAWQEGWVDRSNAELRAVLAPIVAGERWVIDGNYGSTLDLRLARADTVVCLDYPIALCLWRIVRRWLRWRGRSRPDMTPGCPERLDPEFLWYVLTWRLGPGPRTDAALRGFSGQVVRLHSPAEAERWLATLPAAPDRRDS